ncbi:MAG: oxygen-independent coproporphyrinogen III oxidase [Candidatus Latescibacterota bacterium]
MKSHKMTVDVDLLKQYDRPGPRYTSYPTAPYFHEGITQKAYLDNIRKENEAQGTRPISLYFHLPFCDTLCYFCGCNMMVTQNRQKIAQYIDYLEKEIRLLRPHIARDRKVAQMHWGGGTPTHLSPDQIRRLGNIIREHFDFTEDAEIGVEIDPRELTREHMVALAEMGFNRCSMGIQDFDPQVQKAVNRLQSERITRDGLAWARELGFASTNLDLMYGLPYQNTATFEHTLDVVLSLDPDRLAVFNYAHLPSRIKHQRLIPAEQLPNAEEKLQLLKMSIEKLTEAGYEYIGMDHFAKPDDELTVAMQKGTLYRNFQGYSTHAGLDLFALGISSIGMFPELYVQNMKKLDGYYSELDNGNLPVMRGVALSEDDRLRREVITELMCNLVLKKADIEGKYSIQFDEYFAPALEQLKSFQRDDLVILEEKRIRVTVSGRLLIRNIAMNFDAYLQDNAADKPQFSRTV